MKIVLINGNVGSGKSTLAKKLAKAFPQFTHFDIDDYRIRFNPMETMDGEKIASNNFKRDLKQILEQKKPLILSTVGTYNSFVIEYSPLIIQLQVSMKVAMERIQNREKKLDFQKVPFPFIHDKNFAVFFQRAQSFTEGVKTPFVIDTDLFSEEEVLMKVTKIVNNFFFSPKG